MQSTGINKPEVDPDTGVAYLSNDLQRTRLKVALEDVPSTASYRGQQLNAMSEAVKALPAQYQAAALPFLVSLMDTPFKKELVEAIRAAAAQETPQAIEQRIKQVVHDALAKSGADLKMREIAVKEKKGEVEIQKILADGGAQVASMPQIAPIAEVIMQGAGYRRPNPMGDDPNFPTPAGGVPTGVAPGAAPVNPAAVPLVHQNTSPEFPPIPSHGASPMTGIETARTTDNLGAPA